MRFWPFGKEKEARAVDFVSRVVTGPAQDGAVVRAKLTVHFQEETTTREADEVADDAAAALRAAFGEAAAGASLLGQEAQLAKAASGRMSLSANVRLVDVVALHVVSEAPAAAAAPDAQPQPSSHPPPPSSSHPPAARPQSSRPPAPNASKRNSSSQMLAVRDSRLIPDGATPEAAAYAIIPLLRDASTRVLVGILRACDLVIVRGMKLDATSGDDLGDLVPQSTAAPGRFADERRDELVRWEDKLGRERLDGLRTEASAIVCYFLYSSLERAGVDKATSTPLLEAAAQGAFDEEGPLSSMPHYLGVSADPTDALAMKALDISGEPRDALPSFTVMLTPVLASLQEDFAFTSGQIKISVVTG